MCDIWGDINKEQQRESVCEKDLLLLCERNFCFFVTSVRGDRSNGERRQGGVGGAPRPRELLKKLEQNFQAWFAQTWRASYNKGEPLFACGFPSFCRFAPKIHLSCPFLNDKEVSSLASDDSGRRPKTPRAFEKARAKLSDLVCANMASRLIIKSVGSVLSDGSFSFIRRGVL